MTLSFVKGKSGLPVPVIDGIHATEIPEYLRLRYSPKVKRPDLKLLPWHFMLTMTEQSYWEEFYKIPPNATVLDAGAGCGETADFFFKHGAKEVVCVESDPKAITLLVENSEKHGWNVVIAFDKFRAFHLGLRKFDFVKIDVEYGEMCLLDLPSLPHGVVELHYDAYEKFKEHFPDYKFTYVDSNWQMEIP